jgi:hypothetical protein
LEGRHLKRSWAAFVAILVVCGASRLSAGEGVKVDSPDGYAFQVPKDYEVMPALGGSAPTVLYGPGSGQDRPGIQLRCEDSADDLDAYEARSKSALAKDKDFAGAEFVSTSAVSCSNAKGRLMTFTGAAQETILLAVFDGGARKCVLTGRAPKAASAALLSAVEQLCRSLEIKKAEKPAEPAAAGTGGAEPAAGGGAEGAGGLPTTEGAEGAEGGYVEDPLGDELRCEAGGFAIRGPKEWSGEITEDENSARVCFSGTSEGGDLLQISLERLWTDRSVVDVLADLGKQMSEKVRSYSAASKESVTVGGMSGYRLKESYSLTDGRESVAFTRVTIALQDKLSMIWFSARMPTASFELHGSEVDASAASISVFGPGFRRMHGGAVSFENPGVVLRPGEDWAFQHSLLPNDGGLKLDLRPQAQATRAEARIVVTPWGGTLADYAAAVRRTLASTPGATITLDGASSAGGSEAWAVTADLDKGGSRLRLNYKMVLKDEQIYLFLMVTSLSDAASLHTQMESLIGSFRPITRSDAPQPVGRP